MRITLDDLDPRDEYARRIVWALNNRAKRTSRHPLDYFQRWVDGQVDRFLQSLERRWLTPLYWAWLLIASHALPDEALIESSATIIYQADHS